MDRGHILNSQTDSYSSYLGRLFQFQESDYIFMIFVYNVFKYREAPFFTFKSIKDYYYAYGKNEFKKCVAESLVFCVVFCRPLFSCYPPRLVMVLSFELRLLASDYSFSIVKVFLL